MSFDPKNYQFSTGEHREEKVVFVRFPFNPTLKNELREKFSNAKWSASKKCWYLPDNKEIRKEVGLEPTTEMGKTVHLPDNKEIRKEVGLEPTTEMEKTVHLPDNKAIRKEVGLEPKTEMGKAVHLPDNKEIRKEVGLEPKTEMGKTVLMKIHPNNLTALQKMEEQLKLKGYSPNTIKTYCGEFSQLLYILKDVHVDSLTPDRLRSYLLYCITELELSENVIHSRLNAIKFYFEQVLLRDKMFFNGIPRPKKKYILPKVFSKEDLKKIFTKIDNPKHALIVKICYGLGIRVSEVVNLKIEDIDSKRMLVRIENAKGKKDRYVTLPASILEDLRNYYIKYRPKKYLFEGQDGEQYSIRSVQAIFQTAKKKANIKMNVGIHGLRHSYATHLLENGTDMFFIQKLLGHKDIKTTEIYAKVSKRHLGNIKSPLDDI